MAALSTGIHAPDFHLPTVNGAQVSLAEALNKGPVVLAFFKVSCPVCQYAFPFLERAYQANKGTTAMMLGISQDDAKKTKSFMREFDMTFPVALDDPSHYAVSNAYGLTNVPSIFYIEPGGEIVISSVGWSKKDMEALNQKLAALRNQPLPKLWRAGEDVRDFQPG
jgi:peroxiredoxin